MEKVKELEKEIPRLGDTLARKEKTIQDMKEGMLFMETLFDGIHEEIMVVDEHFSVRDANKVFLKHHGQEKADVLGKECYTVMYGFESPCSFHDQPCPLEKAKEIGAMGVFESKDGDKVKVYSVGISDCPYSCEVCAGPHVTKTGQLGHFKILKEEASSAGVRRIKAILE